MYKAMAFFVIQQSEPCEQRAKQTRYRCCAVLGQNIVTGYFTSKQLLLSRAAEKRESEQ